MEKNKEYWLEVYSHPEHYAAEVAEEEGISGNLQSIIKQVKDLAKSKIVT